jgi:membrane-associated phospholipid phosphatase
VRAWCLMPDVDSALGATTDPRQPEPYILRAPRRDAVIAAIAAAVTIGALAAVADRAALVHIQRLDDFWLREMTEGRIAPVTWIAKVFNFLGLVYVTAPVRVAIGAYLAFRRRWWHLVAFAGAVILSEALIGPLKAAYDRTRPPGSLVATTAASFPSGHAVAASVTALAAVIALVSPGSRRIGWGVAAVLFALAMALSRAYLGAHWLSDALAGLLLGTSCALLAASLTDLAQRRWRRRRRSRTSDPAQIHAGSAGRPGRHG